MGYMSQLCGENETEYIEVSKKCLMKLEKNSKELEVYKRALELACEKILERECNALCKGYKKCDNQICKEGALAEEVNEQLQKARE